MASSVADSLKLQIKTLQGVNSSTWTAPPFYGPLTLPELYAFHAEKSPEHPVVVYDDEQGAIREIRYKEMFRANRRAAHYVSRHVTLPDPTADENSVLGVLAIADPITLLTLYNGIMYLGHTIFPISVRNSAVAVAHLARRTSLHHLFVSQDAGMQRLAQEAKDILAKEDYVVDLVPLPSFGDLYNDSEEGLDIPMGSVKETQRCLILHSSGSTAFPKPIPVTQQHLTRWGFLSYFGDFDLCGTRVSMHCLPMFHLMGIITLSWSVCTGVVVGMFRPSAPPVTSTPETVLRAMMATKCEMNVCVPMLLEAWSRSPEAVEQLKSLKCILYAGASLSKDVGEALLDQGVKIMTGFGATEFGAIVRMMVDTTQVPRSDWEYFSFSKPAEFVRIYQAGLPRVFEPVFVECPTWTLNVYNTEMNGRPAYASSDLLEEHPTNPNIYKVYGRADDQIVLSTGEKTNPVPMEAILLQDPNIHAAIIFGRGRLQNGVIVQPKEPFDPSDEAKLEEFRNKIWPTVERVNNFAPSHSRIFKEMITVTKPDKPFQYTAKGTPRRHVSLADYAQEIDELYKKVEESSQVDVQPPDSWTDETVPEFVKAVVKKVMRAPNIADGDDLFQQGCDSLQATWIRNTILHAVRTTTTVSTHDVPLNFVYANPTILTLSAFLSGLISGKDIDKDAQRAKRLEEMQGLVAKYTAKWPTSAWKTGNGGAKPAPAKETVLVTGTTGRLGCHLLAQLAQNPEVAHVYALNREATGEVAKLEARQREALKTWGLDPGILDSGKVSFHPADLTKPQYGLDEKTFDEMQLAVTAILHNAWRVDFNVTLPSFEPLIAGTRNLVDFALKSPHPGGARVLFVSSITSLINYLADDPVPETLDFGPELALGQGYGESKWVTEQILGRAAKETGLPTTVVRVGQLSGDTHAGGWSTSEWVPNLVRAGARLKCLPTTDSTLSWVPVDVAASALLEMLFSGEQVLHLSSPRSASWNDVFAPLAEQLGVALVSVSEWLNRLRQSAQEADRGPNVAGHESAYNLVPFFEAALSRKEVPFDTQKAVKASPTLANMNQIGREDAMKWVQFWQGVGFL
ncbi:acetyl-CoA synthetase-like protein [Cubamyces menziesii]|nr:acetyl-CoA synthetase-like protein [Cubamyces menziesii]